MLGGIRAGSALPVGRDIHAVILFLDVSGFTRITEAASSRGHYGVELVTKVLNRYFGRIHRLLEPLGGEIAKFGGDACLSLIPIQASQMADVSGLLQAILAETVKLDKRFRHEYGFPFQVHGAWGTGRVRLSVVGDPRRHLDYYLSSPALKAVYELAGTAKAGEIPGPAKVPEEPLQPALEPLPRIGSRSARRFLPADIIRKLDLEPRPAELRNATVLFIKLAPIDAEDISPASFQNIYQRVQSIVTKHLGLINKTDFTEKGYLILATFGIPFVYGNDTLRAITAAYRISRLRQPDISIKIGITYSNIYFGIIGAPRRHEYGIIGNAVNIAARLMSFARPGEVCLSKELIPYLEGQFETAYLATAPVKGIAEPLDIHQLVRMLPARWGTQEAQFRSDPLFIDPAVLRELMEGLSSPREFLCQVTGASGTGKSQLVFKLCEPCLDSQPAFQLIQADPRFRDQRLEIFFHCMRQELGITHFREEFSQITDWCAAQGISTDPAILKELLFGGQSSPGRLQIALDAVFDILVALFPRGRMLVLENFHNFDPQSRDLLLKLVKHKLYQGDKLIISSQQTLPEDTASGFASKLICLENWDIVTSESYIRQKIPHITKPAVRMLHQICQGNPRFLRELIQHIQKHWPAAQDLITHQIIEEMRARGQLPNDLENLLRAEYEALRPPEQLFVRLASIYGRPLRLNELDRLFPALPFLSLSSSAELLLRQGILKHEPGSDAQALSFVNPLFPETVYRSILLGEKLAIHRSIATYYSSLESQDEQIWDLIAHHWLKAQDRMKIAWWCGKLARHYYVSGALELSLRMWQQICHWPVNDQALMEAELNCAELLLLLADNDRAEELLSRHAGLAAAITPFHDLWVYLQARLLINRARYADLDAFLTQAAPSVSDPVLKDKIDTAHCEALAQSMDPVRFESAALPLWQRLKDEQRHLAQNVLAGIIGNYYINRGDYHGAASWYREKLKLASRLKDPVSMRIGLSRSQRRRWSRSRRASRFSA